MGKNTKWYEAAILLILLLPLIAFSWIKDRIINTKK